MELTNNETGILYFSGKLNQGLKNIEKKCANIKIVNHKQLSGSLESKKHKVILVDETQRCYIEDLRKIVEYCKENEAKLIFLYDSKQWVTSQSESQKNVNLIVKEAAGNEYKLTDKIRTNKNLSDFVKKYLIRASHNQKTIKAFQ